MGWSGSRDLQRQVRLPGPSVEEARPMLGLVLVTFFFLTAGVEPFLFQKIHSSLPHASDGLNYFQPSELCGHGNCKTTAILDVCAHTHPSEA